MYPWAGPLKPAIEVNPFHSYPLHKYARSPKILVRVKSYTQSFRHRAVRRISAAIHQSEGNTKHVHSVGDRRVSNKSVLLLHTIRFRDVDLKQNLLSNAKWRHAFVSFLQVEDAATAIDELDGHVLEGTPIRVNRSKKSRPSGTENNIGFVAQFLGDQKF